MESSSPLFEASETSEDDKDSYGDDDGDTSSSSSDKMST